MYHKTKKWQRSGYISILIAGMLVCAVSAYSQTKKK